MADKKAKVVETARFEANMAADEEELERTAARPKQKARERVAHAHTEAAIEVESDTRGEQNFFCSFVTQYFSLIIVCVRCCHPK